MAKYDRIVNEVAEFLHTYLKAGYLQIDSFSQKIHQDIDRFEQLFVIRYLLQTETKAFVAQLPTLIRNFKTTTTAKSQTNIAEIRGTIDWEETLRTRMNQNYADPLTFVTNENIRSYETAENLVLKNLLTILYTELYENDYVQSFYNTNWFKEWNTLKENLATILRKNIYLQRVPKIAISDRMIHATKKHRNPLYRKAANLLAQYKRFMRGDFSEAELAQLLRETFILPEEEDVLFELYWIIQIIKQNTDESRLHLMDGRDNIVASWESKAYTYAIYHDSSGPSELSFRSYIDELKNSQNPYTERIYQSFQSANEYRKKFFNRQKQTIFQQGRPDFIITVRQKQSGNLEKIIIGEVKNTKRNNYAAIGLQELLDYIHLAKIENNYIDQKISIKGLLCTDEIDWNENSSKADLVQIVTPTFREGLHL